VQNANNYIELLLTMSANVSSIYQFDTMCISIKPLQYGVIEVQ